MYVDEIGIKILRERGQKYNNEHEKRHKRNKTFKKIIYGLEVIQHIDEETHHAIMVVEGVLFDRGNPDVFMRMTTEEVAELGFRMFETSGFNNLVFCKPEVKEHIVFEQQNENNRNIGNDIKGLKIIKLDPF